MIIKYYLCDFSRGVIRNTGVTCRCFGFQVCNIVTMEKIYKVVDSVQPGTSTHCLATNWSKCILYQE